MSGFRGSSVLLAPAMINAHKRAPHNTNRPWIAVIKSRTFSASFSFESKEGARLYLLQQVRRCGGAVVLDNGYDMPYFRETFVINQLTNEVFSLADLDICYPRNQWHKRERTVCESRETRAARLEKIRAYLAERALRNPGSVAYVAEVDQPFDVGLCDGRTVTVMIGARFPVIRGCADFSVVVDIEGRHTHLDPWEYTLHIQAA